MTHGPMSLTGSWKRGFNGGLDGSALAGRARIKSAASPGFNPYYPMRTQPAPTRLLVFAILVAGWSVRPASATTIREQLDPPSNPGNAFSGTFFVTPSEPVWAFGVGNSAIEDTSISGISSIDGLEANDHWISALISSSSWSAGFDFDSISPIGASPPSSFSIDTRQVPWQWGNTEYVAFYWLSEAGADEAQPLGVLQSGTEYDAFRFFTSSPNSPFATFNEADGGTITTGETIVDGVTVPSPSSTLPLAVLAAWIVLPLTLAALLFRRREP
jgi:hypothetical protein